MAVLKRYICSRHGEFDAWNEGQVRCPAAKCRCKPREQVSAPAIHTTGRTAGADKTLNQLAMDFKMTNIKSTKEGENQAGYFTRNNTIPPPSEPQPRDSVIWGGGGRFDMASILQNGAARPVRDEQVGVKPRDVGVNRGPITASYTADHENLKIQK